MEREMLRNTYGVELEAEFVREVPDGEWPHFEWRVTLTKDDRKYELPFKMGLGHVQTPCKKRIQRYMGRSVTPCEHVRCQGRQVPIPPTLYDVFCSLKADATMGETFDDWCANYGYDTDSRKAMDLYLACQQAEAESRKLLGADWDRLLDDEDYV